MRQWHGPHISVQDHRPCRQRHRASRPVPDAFLDCGILAHGFLWLHCGDCGHDKLVVISCKRRGFVLAPNAKLRALVVPQEPEAPAQEAKHAECEANCAHHRAVRLSGAKLLKRVLAAT